MALRSNFMFFLKRNIYRIVERKQKVFLKITCQANSSAFELFYGKVFNKMDGKFQS